MQISRDKTITLIGMFQLCQEQKGQKLSKTPELGTNVIQYLDGKRTRTRSCIFRLDSGLDNWEENGAGGVSACQQLLPLTASWDHSY